MVRWWILWVRMPVNIFCITKKSSFLCKCTIIPDVALQLQALNRLSLFTKTVIPAKAGIPLSFHKFNRQKRDPRLRGGDGSGGVSLRPSILGLQYFYLTCEAQSSSPSAKTPCVISARFGTAKPKCLKAWWVRMRPLGERLRKPNCSR